MKKNNKFLSFILLTSLVISACSEKANQGLVAATNLKKIGIEEVNLDRIDSLLASGLINNWMAGTTALIAVDGKVIYAKSFGFRDRESKALQRPLDEFRIASMTKPIVTVAALTLIEQGKLNLNDPISKYIPEFKNAKVLATFNPRDTSYTTVDAKEPITIRNLMTHTSGIGYGFADPRMAMIYAKNGIPDLAVADSVFLKDKMKRLASLPLGVQPNSMFYYGLSSDMLGYIVEIVSGKSLDAYLKEIIFEPLKMENTFFFIPTEKASSLSVMYGETKEGRLDRLPAVSRGYKVNYPIAGAKTYLSGGSGLSSNIEDYAKFLQMILNQGSLGGKQILKPETIQLMTSNQIGNLNVGKNKFGLGLEIATPQGLANGSKVGKLSWGGAFNTTFWIDPERKSIAVLMTQVYPAIHKKELFNQFEKLVNDALDK